MKISLSLLLFCLVVTSGRAQTDIPFIPVAYFGLDTTRDLLVVHLADTDTLTFPLRGIRADTLSFTLTEPLTELRYDSSYYLVAPGMDTVSLYFTRLPLIKIGTTTPTLNQYEKRPASFTYVSGDDEVNSTIGIRHRGSYSLRFPKKSFDLEFWEDAESRESVDVTFGDLREDDDWVLDALYNEPLRINSFVAHKLWLDLHQPYYLAEEDEAKSGADVLFAEVFLDGGYHGVYMISEQVDRKQLKLKNMKDGRIRGELYKGVEYTDATLFTGWPALTINVRNEYAGWELKHPDIDDTLSYDKLYDLVGFVHTATDSAFVEEIADRVQLENLRDYFLFLNIATLTDNSGKNVYLARYDDDEPYFYAPWDLDAAFGNRFDGSREQRTELWIENGLQKRVLDLSPGFYASQLCTRYEELRQNLITPAKLSARIDAQIAYLNNNGVYAREALRWGTSVNASDDQVEFTHRHVKDRIAYLDRNVCEFSTAVPEIAAPASPPISVYPNPARRWLTVNYGLPEPTHYVLYSLTGARVRQGILGAEQDRIEVSDLPTGIYLLRVGVRTARIMVTE